MNVGLESITPASPKSPTRRSPLHQVFHGTMWFGFGVAIGRLAPSVMTIVLAWWVGPGDLGIISFVLAYFGLLSFLADWSIAYGVQKLIPEDSARVAEIAWTALFVRLGLSTLVGLLCWALDSGTHIFHGYGGYIALLLVSSAFGTISFVQNARCKFFAANCFTIAFQLLWVAIAMLLVKSGLPVTGPLFGYCLSFVALGLFGFLSDRELRSRIAFLPAVAVDLLKFGLWATTATVLEGVIGQTGILVVAYSSGDVSAGIFKIASTFAMVPTLVGAMVLLPLMPVAKQGLINGDNVAADLARPLVRYLFMIGLPIVTTGCVLAPAVIRTFVTTSYLDAVWPMRILLTGNLLRMFVVALSGILFVGRGLRQLAKVYAITAVVCVTGSILVVSRVEAIGVAFAFLASWVIAIVLLYRWFQRTTPVEFEWTAYLRYALTSLVTAGLVWISALVTQVPALQVMVGGVVTVCVYVFLLWIQRDLAILTLSRALKGTLCAALQV
jgi:O-antigen/teichoic acid export membrane protein